MIVPPTANQLSRAALWLLAAFVVRHDVVWAVEPVAEDNAFFNEQILPILRDRCYDCHSHASGKMKGGLALDSKSGWSQGGESGPPIVPGNPEESLLAKAVWRLDPETAMPPKKALPESEAALLVEWVKRGAPDSRVTAVAQAPSRDWWSLKPLPTPKPPRQGTAAEKSIDGFIRQKLQENGLALSPEADRRTLLRRIYFDLHGLAPSPEEVTAFVADKDPAAYEKIVDHLLESPRYGERWARHWFDTIHFADTHGFEHDEVRENAWRYRDYVIAALNADTPWPQFIREQVAADAIYSDRPRLTAALGFLGAGPIDLSAAGTAPMMFEVVDRDDMVGQTMAAFTSTTVTCARCHDHKFDPITQKDYYALAAVFAGVTKGDLEYDEDSSVAASRERWRQLAMAAEKKDAQVLFAPEFRKAAMDWESARGPVAEWEVPRPVESVSSGGAALELREGGSIFSGGSRPDKETLTITLQSKRRVTAIRVEAMSDSALPKSGPGRQDNGNFHLNEIEFYLAADSGQDVRRLRVSEASADFNQDGWTIAHAIDGDEKSAWGIFPRVGETHAAVFELAEPVTLRAGESLKAVLKQVHGSGHVIGRVRLAVTDARAEQLAVIPAAVSEVLATPAEARSEAQKLTLAAYVLASEAARELAKLPPQAKVYAAGKSVSRKEKKVALDEARTIHVLSRGELNKPGEVATPGALECVDSLQAHFDLKSEADESKRRAALAEWLADPQNPLTWRSIVNRVWHYHFGRGLVDTPNDLGRMGSLPSHPELLDWLAADFRDHGGLLKRLHRQIVLSATYRQSTDTRARGDAMQRDADNRLLWRANRQRLDAESYRDMVLQVAGNLDLTMGGPSVMHFKLGPPVQNTPTLDYSGFDWSKPGVNRRSIYRLVFRNIADPFMVALDFPDAAQLAPVRPFSASALQALTLWNDAFVLRQSQQIAKRVENLSTDSCSRVRNAAGLVWLRQPNEAELKELVKYVEIHGLPALCRVLINTNEFLFVD